MVAGEESVFVPSNAPDKDTKEGLPLYRLVPYIGKGPAGDIGIEIEVEGNKFPKHEYDGYEPVDPEYIPTEWVYHKDGSLRGDDNAEYVLRKPLKFSESFDAVDNLWDMFKKYGSILDVSNRTSVHIHLNACNFRLNRLAAFAALYFSVEEFLTSWCGEHREGNLFCLRAKDAPAIVQRLKQFIVSGGSIQHLHDGLHYAGLNIHALRKFGSLEVRTLSGVTTAEEVKDWVKILERLYVLSERFPDPRAICSDFSGTGPMAYLEMVFGNEILSTLLAGSWMDTQEVMKSVYEGIRYAQDLCYCRDWSEFKPVEVKEDPFGRVEEEKVVPSPHSIAPFFEEYQEVMNIPQLQPIEEYYDDDGIW